MNKEEQIKFIAENAGISQVDAGKAYKAMVTALMEGLSSGKKITVHSFGSFEVVERGERVCRNPRTGEAINVPKHFSVKFRPAEALKKHVNP